MWEEREGRSGWKEERPNKNKEKIKKEWVKSQLEDWTSLKGE